MQDIKLRFVTIWIFARIKLKDIDINDKLGFVTIWIFARIKQGEIKQ